MFITKHCSAWDTWPFSICKIFDFHGQCQCYTKLCMTGLECVYTLSSSAAFSQVHDLKFKFPFYGHTLERIAVTTGGIQFSHCMFVVHMSNTCCVMVLGPCPVSKECTAHTQITTIFFLSIICTFYFIKIFDV